MHHEMIQIWQLDFVRVFATIITDPESMIPNNVGGTVIATFYWIQLILPETFISSWYFYCLFTIKKQYV